MRSTANEKLTVFPSFILFACALIWLDGSCAVPAFFLSAALHEGGHLLALRLLDVPIFGMELHASGAVIRTGQTTPGKEAISAAAGPLVNLLLLLICFRMFPTAALINLLLLAYNLLPVYPLDGGRLLRLLLCAVFGIQAGEQISDFLSAILTVSAVIGGIVLTCVFHAGLYPCLLAALFLCRRTIPACKMCLDELK